MPRAFSSSGSRSVLTPVSRPTSRVLPWSMCPAVPISIGVKLQAFSEWESCSVNQRVSWAEAESQPIADRTESENGDRMIEAIRFDCRNCNRECVRLSSYDEITKS